MSDRKSRHKRIRAKVKGTKDCLRLSVFRSNRYLYAQLIDDDSGITKIACDTSKMKGNKSKIDKAKELGKEIAKKAIEFKMSKVVFDRGGYNYHGRVQAVAEGAREGGLKL